jgi:FMN phosphatase YigB (HAD superfamily)
MKAVVFDFGYTLVNEDRVFRTKAAQLGVAETDFFAALGAVIERRLDHKLVYERLGARAPDAVPFEPQDFYDDALPALSAAKKDGRVVGIAGNFDEQIEDFLAGEVEVDFVASSAKWGVEKPELAFFEHIVYAAGCAAQDITYVGDRIDNDVLPATRAGMNAVFVLRGPWAAVQRSWPEADPAPRTVSDLSSVRS